MRDLDNLPETYLHLTPKQRNGLLMLMHRAFVRLRYYVRKGLGEQATDLANIFKDLPRQLSGALPLNLKEFVDKLDDYEHKYEDYDRIFYSCFCYWLFTERDTPPKWIASEKPSPTVCPKGLCSMWVAAGGTYCPGLYRSLDEALKDARLVKVSSCQFSQPCVRNEVTPGKVDAVICHSAILARIGLPWFYFFPRPESVIEELRELYIEESEELWGKRHWLSFD